MRTESKLISTRLYTRESCLFEFAINKSLNPKYFYYSRTVARLRRIEAQLDKIKEAGSEEKETLKAQVLDLETKVNAFSTREEQWAQTKQELEAALKDMEDKIATKDNKIVDLIMTVKELNDSISDLENQKSTLEAEAVQHTLLRRKLHNEIQELKGCAPFFIYTLTHSHIYAYLLL